jgi:murein DD-endopeptidase MepM/ murein hydrolase activator NlpD
MKTKKRSSSAFAALTIFSSAVGLNALSTMTPLTQSAQAAYYQNCLFSVRIYQPTNVRPDPNTSRNSIASLSTGSTVWMSTFVEGQPIYDVYAKANDTKWFKLRDQAGYVASAVVDGYPPTSPCSKPPTGQVDMGGLQKLLFGTVPSTVTSTYAAVSCAIWGPSWKPIYTNCAHPALDIAGPVNTPIYSPVDGVVIGRNDSIGSTTVYNAKSDRTFFFVHMNRTDVTIGQQVSKGKQVGIEGTQGNVTGAHLHFEARAGRQLYVSTGVSQSVNPLDAVNLANR